MYTKNKQILKLITKKYLYSNSFYKLINNKLYKDYFGCVNVKTQKFAYQILNFIREKLLKKKNFTFRNELDLFINFYEIEIDSV